MKDEEAVLGDSITSRHLHANQGSYSFLRLQWEGKKVISWKAEAKLRCTQII